MMHAHYDQGIVGQFTPLFGERSSRGPSDEFASHAHLLEREQFDSDCWGPRFMVLVGLVWGAGLAIGFQAALAILVALGFGAAIVGLFRPVIGLFGIGMLCTVDAMMRAYLLTGGLLRWNTFNYWLLIVMVIAIPLILRANDRQTGWLTGFVLLLCLELFETPGVEAGVFHILSVVTVLGMRVYFTRASLDGRAIYWLGMITGTVSAAGGLLFFLQRHGLPRIDENAFSYFPLTGLFGICLAFPIAVREQRGVKLLGALAFITSCWVMLIGSRGGILVGLSCLLYLVLMIPGRSQRFALASAAILVLVGVTSQFAEMREHSLERVGNLFDSERSAARRTSGRSDLALGAWMIFCENPMGVGTGGFAKNWARISVEQSQAFSGYKRGKEQTCHSAWMKTFAENGVPGFLLLGGYVLSFAAAGWRDHRREMCLLGILTSVCLAQAFVSTEFAGKGLWLLAAGATEILNGDLAILRDSENYV